MSAYNAPTETLPRFNSAVFIQDAKVSYPVAQGALTIPKNITIVDESNIIIITPTSITINGIVYNLSNIAYLNLSQTFTGVNTFTQKIVGFLDTNTPSVNITQFSSLTSGTLFIAPTITTGNINIGCSSTNIITGITTGNINIGSCRSFTGMLNVGGLFNVTSVNGNAIKIGSSLSTITIGAYTDTTTYSTLNLNGAVSIGSVGLPNYLLGTTTISSILTNSINPVNPTDNIQMGSSQTTGTITLGNPQVSSNVITGLTNVISGASSNTINGATTITNTLLANTLTGKTTTDAISLYTTTTGNIVLGNSASTTGQMLIYGAVSGTSKLFSNVVSGSVAIGNMVQTGTTDIFGSMTNTNSLFTNTTSGSVDIGSSNQGGYMNIWGGKLVGAINNIFTNVTTGAINIGAGLTSGVLTIGSSALTGVMTIYGSTTNTNNLFENVTTGDIYLGAGLTSGAINIGGASQTGRINIGSINLSTKVTGLFIRGLPNAAGIQYYLDRTTYISSTGIVIGSPFSRYYVCDLAYSGTIILPPPSINYEGIEIVIRYLNSVITPTTAGGGNVFINLSNAVTSTLSGTVSYRIICGNKSSVYYWIQII